MSISRPLTAGEITLAKSVFGDSIDYTTVKVSDGRYLPTQPFNTAMTSLDGKLYMNNLYRADYATESAEDKGLFIHEMTHVWQGQNKVMNQVAAVAGLMLKHNFNYNAAYPFLLDAGKDLTDYGLEQQASIVQEYYIVKRAGMASHRRHCENTCSNDEKIKLYEKVLEKFLKNPGYARRDRFPSIFKINPPKP